MLWGQRIKVYTDHKNLTTEALGLTSNRVYRWRLILEEYGPDIVYIKGAENTVADAISRREFNPALKNNSKQNWMTMTKYWSRLEKNLTNNSEDKHFETFNQVFAHHGEEDEIYPLTIKVIVEAQKRDKDLKKYFKPKTIIKKVINFKSLKK